MIEHSRDNKPVESSNVVLPAAPISRTLARLTSELEGKSVAELRAISLELEGALVTVAQALEKQAFIEKFGIKIGKGPTITVNLGDTPYSAFLRKAQILARRFFGVDAVKLATFVALAQTDSFQRAPGKEIVLDASGPGPTSWRMDERGRKVWPKITLEDLAIAHAAYLIVTGKDLFDNSVVCVANSALKFSYSDGLEVLAEPTPIKRQPKPSPEGDDLIKERAKRIMAQL